MNVLLLVIYSFLLCQQQGFVYCIQPLLNSTQHDILHMFYQWTGGVEHASNTGGGPGSTTGGWDFSALDTCLYEWGGEQLQGRLWNFTKNTNGDYIFDPCQNTAGTSILPFAGLSCTCNTVSCGIDTLYLPCANLQNTIPSFLGGLTQLTLLDLDTNALVGRIPDSIGLLAQLETLSFDTNWISGSIPSSLGNLVSLTELFLYNNLLTGSIPEHIQQLTLLQFLDLDNNSLTGSVPNWLGTFPYLQILALQLNNMTSTLPESLGNLKQLYSLRLSANSLVGEIPCGYGSLSRLLQIDLSTNLLTGQIPEELTQLSHLRTINFAKNSFSGVLPSGFSELRTLHTLLLQNNYFTSAPGPNAFNFINPTLQTNLTVLDISANKFTGTLMESVFALPRLEVLLAGTNCFVGSLPTNICQAKHLRTLALSGLSAGASCRNNFWENTFMNTWFGFKGFGAEHFMRGDIPQCIYSMPNLTSFHASGNSFLGQAPFSDNISPSLRDIDISRNKLTGTISNDIATATCSSSTLLSIDMSYNRINGTLAAFDGAGGCFTNASFIALSVNRLSGNIPQSLLEVKNINVLAGNVFGCEYNRGDLPYYDAFKEPFQCGSTIMNNMLYFFGFFVSVLSIVVLLVRQRQWIRKYFSVMKFWYEVADGQRVIDSNFEITHMKRYSDFHKDCRSFIFVIGVALIFVFIVYASLSGSSYRTIEYAYTWMTTAAYLTGDAPTAWLACMSLCLISLTWLLLMQNQWANADITDVGFGISLASPSDDNSRDSSRSSTSSATTKSDAVGADSSSFCFWDSLRVQILLFGRVFILIVMVWGAILGSNVLYLHILLRGTSAQQESFKFFFAAFKLIWTMGVTPYLFYTPYLRFGLVEEQHDTFINFWFGGKVKMMFWFNVMSIFWIPMITIIVVRHDCFYNAFTPAAAVPVSFNYNACSAYNPDGRCFAYADYTVESIVEIPFVYNYTCSPSMIRAYVPLYQQMFIILIARSVLQLLYLSWDISNSENEQHNGDIDIDIDSNACGRTNNFPVVKQKQQQNVSFLETYVWKRLRWIVLKTMPTRYLMYNSKRRFYTMKDGIVFSDKPRLWISNSVPSRLGNILILLTFGVLAPILAMMIVLAIVLDTYVSQLVLGRFIVTELGVLLERKRLIDSSTLVIYTHTQRNYMKKDIEDANKSWGALAVLEKVESQCRFMPASCLSMARFSYILTPAITIAFVVVDVLNSRDGALERRWWPSIVLVCLACVLEIFTIVYNHFTQVVIRAQPSNFLSVTMKSGNSVTGIGIEHSQHSNNVEMSDRNSNIGSIMSHDGSINSNINGNDNDNGNGSANSRTRTSTNPLHYRMSIDTSVESGVGVVTERLAIVKSNTEQNCDQVRQ